MGMALPGCRFRSIICVGGAVAVSFSAGDGTFPSVTTRVREPGSGEDVFRDILHEAQPDVLMPSDCTQRHLPLCV